MKHLSTKRLKDKTTYIAWFSFDSIPPFANKLRFKIGIWAKKVDFELEEITSKQSGPNYMVTVKASSMTLKTFRKIKVEWISGEKVVFKEQVKNSKIFDDLADPKTFLAAEEKLKKAFA